MWRRLVEARVIPRRSLAGVAAQPGCRSSASVFILPSLLAGAGAGALTASAVCYWARDDPVSRALAGLPRRIILVRHGESEGNADHTLYRTKADNLIELTDAGAQQALEAGRKIKKIVGNDKVHLRAMNLASAGKSRHLLDVFSIAFLHGESGCDVYDRAKQWWDTLMLINERPGHEHVDSVVVVTHGLTMRLILMQLYGWSPDTFHTVWNAENCNIYVLEKDLSLRGFSPYKHNKEEGDYPKSSTEIAVKLRSGERKSLKLDDYLTIPPPRTRQHDVVRKMLKVQHGLEPEDVVEIEFFKGSFRKYS